MSFASLTQSSSALIRSAVAGAGHEEGGDEVVRTVQNGVTGKLLEDGTFIPGFWGRDGSFTPLAGAQIEEEGAKPRFDDPVEFRGFSSIGEKGLQFEQVVNFIIGNAFTDAEGVARTTGMTTSIDDFVNAWAVEWRQRHNIGLDHNDRRTLDRLADEIANFDTDLGTEEELERLVKERRDLLSKDRPRLVPELQDLMGEEGFLRGMKWLSLMARGVLPPLFTSEQELFDDDGKSIGVHPLIATTNLLTGVEFVRADLASDPRVWGTKAASAYHDLITSNPRGAISQDIINASHATGFDHLDPLGGIDDVFLMNLFRDNPPELEVTVPHIPMEELNSLQVGAPTAPRGPSSGVSRDIVFDRNQLIEQVDNMWRSWFLEGPNDQRVASVVDDYVDEARAFWSGKAGKLDFDTFVRDRLREESRYQTIFRNKPPAILEEQFVAQFQQPISSLGLRAESALTQTEAAVTSGGGPAEQLKRVTRTSEFQNLGGFSTRLARTVQGLGAGGQS